MFGDKSAERDMIEDAFFMAGKENGEDGGRGVSGEGGTKDVRAAGLGQRFWHVGSASEVGV
ncbi:hypothetical protein Hypma_014576 [Hypsizygus marmoreus]|uniref:Uncharacterized protein n=1 Tax=Hypsizygus marmoreus TaxID=39966 RepID=A0A369JE66_HYPMA|nr:hypothetical protein Hypma_014576 [Hypsizygus marmoreus]